MCQCIYCIFDIIFIIPHFESFELQVMKFNYSVFKFKFSISGALLIRQRVLFTIDHLKLYLA